MLNKIIEEEIKELNLKKDDLETRVTRLQTSVGKEEELRKKFQIKKPGEEMLVIVEQEPAADSASAVEQKKNIL